MAVDKIQVSIPSEFVPVLQHGSGGESLDEAIRHALAVSLFVERSVTLERAAHLSGLSLAAFMSELEKKGIPWAEYTEEDFEQDNRFMQGWVAQKNEGKDETGDL